MKKIIGLLLGLLLCLNCAMAEETQAAPQDVSALCGAWTGYGDTGGDLPCMVIHEDGTLAVYELPILLHEGEQGQLLFWGAYTYDPATGLFTFPEGSLDELTYRVSLSATEDEYDEEADAPVNAADEPVEKGTPMLMLEGLEEDPDLGAYVIGAVKMASPLLPSADELCESEWCLYRGEWYNPFGGDEGEEATAEEEPDEEDEPIIDRGEGFGNYLFSQDGSGVVKDDNGETTANFVWSLDGERLTVNGDVALNGTYFIQHAVHPSDDETTDMEAVEEVYGSEVLGNDCWLDPDTLMLNGVEQENSMFYLYRSQG